MALCIVCTGIGTAIMILPLGDSITHGSSGDYPSYRPWLYEDLRSQGYDVDFVGSSHTPALAAGLDPDNEGHSGYTAGKVLAGLPGWLALYPPPDVALVHLGTNDVIQYLPRNRTIADLTAIVGTLRTRNPSMTVLVAQIIPTSVASTNARIVALNAEIAGLQSLSTPQSRIVIVDQYGGYAGVADNQPGGVHPLTSGERKMAERWKLALIPVLDGAPSPAPWSVPRTVPGRIEAEDYDSVGFVDSTPGNAGNAYRHDDVDIEFAASEGSYAVGWIRDGEALSYTTDVTGGGLFRLGVRVASPNDGRAVAVEVDGTVRATVPVPRTGSFDVYATVSQEIALPVGRQNLTLRFLGDGLNINWFELAPLDPAPTWTVPPLPPQDVSGLANSTYEPTSITWTWTDPPDPSFANVSVLLDGRPAGMVGRGVQRYTATGIAPASPHTIATRTRNTAGVDSATWANHTAWTSPLPTPQDAVPPASVTGLANAASASTFITWTWSDPPDADFAEVAVWLDGQPAGTVARGIGAFTATDIAPGSEHTISTRTADAAGNLNSTWRNHTARTAPALLPVPPGDLPPGDLDGDGVYEDVNGNGRADFADVALYFNRMAWIAENEPVGRFDCNVNGRIDFADVVWLFNQL